MKLTIPYNVTGKARKRLTEDVSVALNTIPRYMGTPTMSYQIGDCLLNRNGTLTIPDTVDSHTAQTLMACLDEHGYEGEAEETTDKDGTLEAQTERCFSGMGGQGQNNL